MGAVGVGGTTSHYGAPHASAGSTRSPNLRPSVLLPPPAHCHPPPACVQVTHSATQEQLEVIQTLQPMFEEHILPLLTPIDELWQPTDFLPDSRDQDQFYQEVRWEMEEVPCGGSNGALGSVSQRCPTSKGAARHAAAQSICTGRGPVGP